MLAGHGREQDVHARRRRRHEHLRPGPAVLLGHPGDHAERPDAGPVQVAARRRTRTPRRSASSAGTSASRTTAIIKEDILKKIADGGYEFNDLYELVPVGGQDFSQVLPKIKANEPDILLVSIYGQDPGSFANQAATAGLHGAADRLRVHARRRQRLEGHVRLRRLHVRLRLLRPETPDEPAGQEVRRGLQRRIRRGPRLLRRQLLRERVRDVGADAAHLGRRTPRPRSRARRSTPRCRRTSPSSASTAATSRTLGTYTLDGDDALRDQARDGRVRVQGRRGHPEGVLRHRRRRLPARPDAPTTPTGRSRRSMLAAHLRDVPPTDRRRLLPRLQLRPARGRLRARSSASPGASTSPTGSRTRSPRTWRSRSRSASDWPFWPVGGARRPARRRRRRG